MEPNYCVYVAVVEWLQNMGSLSTFLALSEENLLITGRLPLQSARTNCLTNIQVIWDTMTLMYEQYMVGHKKTQQKTYPPFIKLATWTVSSSVFWNHAANMKSCTISSPVKWGRAKSDFTSCYRKNGSICYTQFRKIYRCLQLEIVNAVANLFFEYFLKAFVGQRSCQHKNDYSKAYICATTITSINLSNWCTLNSYLKAWQV